MTTPERIMRASICRGKTFAVAPEALARRQFEAMLEFTLRESTRAPGRTVRQRVLVGTALVVPR